MEILILGVLVIGVMVLSTRSTRKRQAAAMEFRDRLQPGDEVVTTAGFYGYVVEVEDDVVYLEATPDGALTKWSKQALVRQVTPQEAVADDASAEDARVIGDPTDDAPVDLVKDRGVVVDRTIVVDPTVPSDLPDDAAPRDLPDDRPRA